MGIFDSLFGNKKRVNSDKTDALKQFGMSESHKDFSLQDRRWKDSLTYQQVNRKLTEFEILNDNQKRNSQLLLILSAVYQLILSDGEISYEEREKFDKFKIIIENKMNPDGGLSIDEASKKLVEFISDADNVSEALGKLPEKELEQFWEYLIAFSMADGELAFEELNYIGVIIRNIYRDKSDDEIRDFINVLVSKYSHSQILLEMTDNKSRVKRIIKHPNGKIYIDSSEKDGKLDGPLKSYYESGKLQLEVNYDMGKVIGLRKEYNSQGILVDESNWKNGIENGPAKLYHDNGNLKQEEDRKKGELDGLVKVYDETGALRSDQIYVNGEETGRHRIYYPDGVLKGSMEKIKGEEKGLMKAFWETGELKVELNYDTLLMRTYTPDGDLYEERTLEE